MRFISKYFLVFFVFCLLLYSCEHTINTTKTPSTIVQKDTIENKNDSLPFVGKSLTALQIEFGEKLKVSADSIVDVRLYQFIKKNLGEKCFGVNNQLYNCESFLQVLLKEVYDISIPPTIKEQMSNKNIELFKGEKFFKKGDLIFFNYSAKQLDKISHVGFYLQNGYFLLASYDDGVVITKFNNGYWNKRFNSAGRIIK
jgi:NlpC/P60 family